ncbi:MAG: ABC transporter ATP-binding protein [Clostridia bacterium]|nr:ABC transporter ATP-binding protein [Clostridia bacterium]
MTTQISQAAPLLKVNDIHVYYGAIHAIKGISLEVHQGEIVTLIGANGAGKSTTLNTIAGLLKPRQGAIEMNGASIQGTGASKMVSKGLALCPEGRRIFQQMTVKENLEMGAYSRPKSEINASLEEMFQRFPRLKEREKQVAGTLSGGEQQMLAMARALMSKPRLLMLDEPSMGLAPILVEQIFSIITELHGSGVTVLLVEQNAQMALQVADRAYVMETGLITMQGPANELLHNDAVQKAYLGS